MAKRKSLTALENPKNKHKTKYERTGSLGTGQRHFGSGTWTCADCGHPLATGDKGAECVLCKRWPLCETCVLFHKNDVHKVESLAHAWDDQSQKK